MNWKQSLAIAAGAGSVLVICWLLADDEETEEHEEHEDQAEDQGRQELSMDLGAGRERPGDGTPGEGTGLGEPRNDAPERQGRGKGRRGDRTPGPGVPGLGVNAPQVVRFEEVPLEDLELQEDAA